MLGRGPPPIRLQGIMGSEALFGASPDDAQPMKVGDALPDGRKIVEIRSNEVVLEKDGQRQTETVFQQLQQQPTPGPRPACRPAVVGPLRPMLLRPRTQAAGGIRRPGSDRAARSSHDLLIDAQPGNDRRGWAQLA